ncbi:MAG: T9SS type A sorting domain-containing protein [Saprospiraceae bacterium]
MKQFITLFFLLLTCSNSFGQNLLWGGPNDPKSTFSGGLGTWTTTGLSSSNPDSTANSLWVYSASGTSKGAYSDQSGSINSPSKANGAAIFDSDFLDNGGVEGNEGKGISPSSHSGALTSPLIDCSSFPTVTVSFYQYYQNYLSTCELQVSSDSGATWTSYSVNANVRPGTGTSRSSRQIIDISGTAASNKNVYFRFVFSGDYYFWTIDDVTLLSLPDNDLALIKVFYPPSSYAQPKSQLCNEKFNFKSKISNLGGSPQSGVQYKAEIFADDRTTRVYADSLYLTNNLNTSDDNIDISTPRSFDPSTLSIGKYYIRTSLLYNNTDYNPADNVKVDSFEVTNFTYAKESRARIGIRANGGTGFTVGSQYATSDCWNPNDRFFASTAEVGLTAGSIANNKDYTVRINLAEVKAEVAADFSNFDGLHGLSSSSIQSVLSDQELTANITSTLKTYKLNLVNATNEKVFLNKGSRYILLCTHPAESDPSNPDTWKFQVCSNEKNYEGHAFSVPVYDNDGNWFDSWPDGDAPVLRMEINVVTKNDDIQLPESVINISPNPVQNDLLTIKLQFAKETDANITIFDLNGKVLNFQSYPSVKNNAIQIPVSELTQGEYFVRVSTNDGTRTKIFIK